MRLDYPELADYDEFKELSARELKFCWFMGNRTSPLVRQNLQKKVMLNRAISESFGKSAKNREDVKQMLAGDIPENIMLGIKRMATFSPSVRLRARFMNEYIFDRLEEVIMLDETVKKSLSMDEKKRYADLLTKVTGELPDVVKQMEGGFGLRVKAKKKSDKAEVKVKIGDLSK